MPEEIDEAISKLSFALEIVKCRKNTNSKFVDNKKRNLFAITVNRRMLTKMAMTKIKFKPIFVKIAKKSLVLVPRHNLHTQN